LEHEINVTTTRDLAITFSGGGNKSFYQLGLLRGWGARLLDRVAAVAACSAGACVAALYLSGREDEVWSFWQERRRAVTRNFEWHRLLRGQRPTPHHEPIYRELLLVAFEHGGLERICSQPFPLFVLTALPPRWCPMPAAMLLGLGAHKLEHSLRPDLIHSTFAARIGFQSLAFDARECRTREELTDLILASSATPPFTHAPAPARSHNRQRGAGRGQICAAFRPIPRLDLIILIEFVTAPLLIVKPETVIFVPRSALQPASRGEFPYRVTKELR
jgi:hypothetical protein